MERFNEIREVLEAYQPGGTRLNPASRRLISTEAPNDRVEPVTYYTIAAALVELLQNPVFADGNATLVERYNTFLGIFNRTISTLLAMFALLRMDYFHKTKERPVRPNGDESFVDFPIGGPVWPSDMFVTPTLSDCKVIEALFRGLQGGPEVNLRHVSNTLLVLNSHSPGSWPDGW